jgi:hypothetical protein
MLYKKLLSEATSYPLPVSLFTVVMSAVESCYHCFQLLGSHLHYLNTFSPFSRKWWAYLFACGSFLALSVGFVCVLQ